MEENVKDKSESTTALARIGEGGADWDFVKSINEGFALWINEQMHAVNATKSGALGTGSLELFALSKVAVGAYGEAAKKNYESYVGLIIWAMRLASDMEETREEIKKGAIPEMPLSEYLESALPWIMDSLEFGSFPSGKEALMKQHMYELAQIKDAAFNAIADGCDATVAKQTTRAKALLEVGTQPLEMLKEVARESYFDGAYEGIDEVKKLKASAEKILVELSVKKAAIKDGASPEIPASKYFEEFIPLIRERMKSDGIKRIPNKVKA